MLYIDELKELNMIISTCSIVQRDGKYRAVGGLDGKQFLQTELTLVMSILFY